MGLAYYKWLGLLLFILASIGIAIALPPTPQFSTVPPAQEVYLDNTAAPHPFYQVVEDLLEYSKAQKKVLIRSFEVGDKIGLAYTLPAIAMHESYAGKTLINLKDPSGGPYHNLVTSVMTRRGINDTPANRNCVMTKLITNREYAEESAISELRYWQHKYKGKPQAWSKTVASYNAGHEYRNGSKYLKAIKANIKILKGL